MRKINENCPQTRTKPFFHTTKHKTLLEFSFGELKDKWLVPVLYSENIIGAKVFKHWQK
jgi:hypothetical protein